MVRAPCCEKMGLKKGPWTPEEDQILINYIQLHGHGNWRALPKQAGLLRCGKSCRLRWTNYLRPDIKRGNFTREEEDTIINLHEMLGNKRLKHSHGSNANNRQPIDPSEDIKREQQPVTIYSPVSPPQSSSDVSTSENNSNSHTFTTNTETNEDVSEIDENFWSEVLSADNSSMAADFRVVGSDQYFPSSPPPPLPALETVNGCGSNLYDTDANMDFWYNLFTRAADLPELPEF
ncbi:hypothetical protein GOBAR_AA23851 [Gossypium barbadense]|uniref:Uncharacterized protein n=1 Tax=Gossypium barbadense TaxID=3634 RepID=A0A2P5X0H4_GOSBA|nr:hypothetical protein GOBAR_AA23851 [Gossypium barbadense]